MSQARTMSMEEQIRGLSPFAAHTLASLETHPKRPRTDVPQNRQNFKETPDEPSISYAHTSGAAGITDAPPSTTDRSSSVDGSIQAQKEKGGKISGSFWKIYHSLNATVFGGNETIHLPVQVHSQVCGKTLNTHLALMKQVDNLGLKREETSAEDCQVMMVFCPVTSHVGTDIEAAMSHVPGNRDAILVVMHHTFDHDFVTSQRSAPHYKNIVEKVDVLFHDSKGLLHCKTNNEAVTLIHKALQKYNRST